MWYVRRSTKKRQGSLDNVGKSVLFFTNFQVDNYCTSPGDAKRIVCKIERVEIQNNINMVGRAEVMLNKTIKTGRTGVWGICVGVITLIGNACRILQHAPS